MTIKWIQHETRGGAAPQSEYNFRISSHKSGAKHTKQTVVVVYEKTMKELRWVVGDKVMIGIEGNHVFLKRVLTGGFTLSMCGNKRDDAKGKMLTSAVRATYPIGLTESVYVNQYEVLADGVVKVKFKETA